MPLEQVFGERTADKAADAGDQNLHSIYWAEEAAKRAIQLCAISSKMRSRFLVMSQAG